MSKRLPPVLCAEDEESDALILKHSFEKMVIANPLVIVTDGRQIVDYLSGAPPFDDREANPLPALIVLDLKMPLVGGFDVLAWLSTRPELKHIPVVVLSSSMAEGDMQKARELGAKEYIVKPNDLHEYFRLVRDLHVNWLPGSASR